MDKGIKKLIVCRDVIVVWPEPLLRKIAPRAKILFSEAENLYGAGLKLIGSIPNILCIRNAKLANKAKDVRIHCLAYNGQLGCRKASRS